MLNFEGILNANINTVLDLDGLDRSSIDGTRRRRISVIYKRITLWSDATGRMYLKD